MKRIISVILSLAMTFAMVLTFSSCDFSSVLGDKENAEEKTGYELYQSAQECYKQVDACKINQHLVAKTVENGKEMFAAEFDIDNYIGKDTFCGRTNWQGIEMNAFYVDGWLYVNGTVSGPYGVEIYMKDELTYEEALNGSLGLFVDIKENQINNAKIENSDDGGQILTFTVSAKYMEEMYEQYYQSISSDVAYLPEGYEGKDVDVVVTFDENMLFKTLIYEYEIALIYEDSEIVYTILNELTFEEISPLEIPEIVTPDNADEYMEMDLIM